MQGVITAFNENTLVGEVLIGPSKRLKFHSTTFQSDTSFRWPRIGETVEVVFNNANQLLSIHGK